MAIHSIPDLMRLINDLPSRTAVPPPGPVEFYSAVAQIIPVLLLAYLLQIPFHKPPKERFWGRYRWLGIGLSIANMILVMAAEGIAVAAVFRRGHLPLWLTCVVWVGLATPLACLAVFLDQRIRHPERYAAR